MRYLALCVALILSVTVTATAQTNVDLGGFQADPTAPVEINADNLSVDQATGRAVFSGNVSITQGDLNITAGLVEITYDGTSGQVTHLTAGQGVIFVTETDSAKAETAEYDLVAQTLAMAGGVTLTQGASTISADSMTVNLATGAAQLDGRVTTTFVQTGGNE